MGAYCSSGSQANTTPRASDPSAVPGPGSKQPAKRYSNATLSDKQIQILEERNVSDAGAFSTDAVALRYAW